VIYSNKFLEAMGVRARIGRTFSMDGRRYIVVGMFRGGKEFFVKELSN
jgi:hypothetical protein